MWAQKYVAPSSGTLEISEIGAYEALYEDNARWAIFEHDAVNDCPGAMVANSDTGAVMLMNAGCAKGSYTYPGTKPQITGGTTYWLAQMQDAACNPSYSATGGYSLYAYSQTYGTWPTDTGWHTHTDLTPIEVSIYVVYTAGGGATNVVCMVI
jgi:hypothetical protein